MLSYTFASLPSTQTLSITLRNVRSITCLSH